MKYSTSKFSESELLDSSNYFKILDNLEVIIFISDVQSHEILYVNKTALNHLGSVNNKPCWQYLYGEVAGPCSFCSTKPLSSDDGKPLGSLNYDIQNSTTRGWYEVHERPITLLSGRSVRIHLATDITEKKKIDEELCRSEAKYRTVADYTYDWECWLNKERNFEYISPSCKRITGYTVEEFLADSSLLEKIIHPEDRPDFIRHQEEVFESPTYSHLEYRITTKEGDTRWISHYCQPVYTEDGAFAGRRSSNRDITDRKNADKKTKLNELRLSILTSLYEKKELDTKNLCEFVLESSLPITSSSIGFLGFINEDEAVMTIHSWSKNVMRECAVYNKALEFYVCDAGVWGDVVRERKPVMINDFSSDFPHRKGLPDGHVEINRFLAVPLLANNKVVSMVGVGNKHDPYTPDDVAQLQLLLEGMWQILQRKEAEKKAITQSEKIRHFASAVSHDLKNPAISVYGLAKLLKEKYAQGLDEKALRYCEQIMKSSEQISLLAEDINIYITTRETESDFEVLALQELWNTIRLEFLQQLETNRVNWVEPDIERVQITGNRVGILRVFRNLVENALKYGGKNLSEITVGYKSSETHHILMVGNNGAGIDADDAKIIFKEFKRKSKSSKVKGSGLGLAIVNEIAKKHKGRSWLIRGSNGEPVFCVSVDQTLTKKLLD